MNNQTSRRAMVRAVTVVCAAMLYCGVQTGHAETKKFKPEKGVQTFAVREPVLRVKPGDVVSFDPYAVKLVLDKNGEMDMTNSAYARGGDQAIIPESAIRYVVT